MEDGILWAAAYSVGANALFHASLPGADAVFHSGVGRKRGWMGHDLDVCVTLSEDGLHFALTAVPGRTKQLVITFDPDDRRPTTHGSYSVYINGVKEGQKSYAGKNYTEIISEYAQSVFYQ